MIDLDFKYRETINELKSQAPFVPDIALILGSGLGDFAESTKIVKTIPTDKLPNYPLSTVKGHKGYIHFSELNDKKLLIFQGRIHFYEGYNINECILPVFLTNKLDCKKLILTNAAGGINPDFEPGDLMLITSMNSINIKREITELIRLASIEQKNDFLDFPSDEINTAIRQAAINKKIALKEGTYWITKGPSYETPAEIKMIDNFDGDAVGMSTVHEAVFASSLGIKVGAISLITNLAAGISKGKLSHQEVIDTAELAKSKFEKLIKNTIELI